MHLYLKGIMIGLMLLVGGCAPKQYITQNGNVLLLSLESPRANSVLFASSLNRFKLIEMNKTTNGHWSIEHPSMSEFRYFYIVDGNVFIPDCQIKELDDFGQDNCIYQPLTIAPDDSSSR